MSETVIIGGSAAGLMAACAAADKGCRVTVAEKNERPARKLMITGRDAVMLPITVMLIRLFQMSRKILNSFIPLFHSSTRRML